MKPAPPDPPQMRGILWSGYTGHIGWDIGANCGQTLDEMTRRFRTVIAFEPAVECTPYLVKWVAHKKVVHMAVAVSDLDGHLHLAATPDKIDTGQLVTPGTAGMEWDPDAPGAELREVPCRSVDSLAAELKAPDFLKIDVEGHEKFVLQGARQTLADKRPAILLEFHTPQLHWECQELLGNAGYVTCTVRHPHYTPGSDMWFQHGWLRAFPE